MSMKGKKHSEETKKKMSEKSKGNQVFLGHKHSEETKLKMSKPRPNRRGISPWNKGIGKFKTPKEKELHFNLKKYGLNEIKYNEILVSQNYVCAICLKSETKKHQNGKVINLSVDHNHTDGKVRGLLCCNCNFAIGHFNDNPYLCEKAMQYLLNN